MVYVCSNVGDEDGDGEVDNDIGGDPVVNESWNEAALASERSGSSDLLSLLLCCC